MGGMFLNTEMRPRNLRSLRTENRQWPEDAVEERGKGKRKGVKKERYKVRKRERDEMDSIRCGMKEGKQSAERRVIMGGNKENE